MKVINIGNGASNRERLNDNNRYSIRFKNVFSDYEMFKETLIYSGVDESDINEYDFDNLLLLYGNAFVKWNHIKIAQLNCGFNYKKVLQVYKFNKESSEKDFKDLLKNEMINTTNQYSTNENDAESNRKYLSSSQENISQVAGNLIDNYLNIQDMLQDISAPKEMMYKQFAINVLAILQPSQNDENLDYDKGGLQGYEY